MLAQQSEWRVLDERLRARSWLGAASTSRSRAMCGPIPSERGPTRTTFSGIGALAARFFSLTHPVQWPRAAAYRLQKKDIEKVYDKLKKKKIILLARISGDAHFAARGRKAPNRSVHGSRRPFVHRARVMNNVNARDTRDHKQRGWSWFSLLPDELVVAVLLALGDDPRTIASWGLTCKRHADIAHDPTVLQNMCAIRFPAAVHERFADFDKDCRWVYRARSHIFHHEDATGAGTCAISPPPRVCTGRDNVARRWVYYGDFWCGHASGYGVGFTVDEDKLATAIKLLQISAPQGEDKCEGLWDNDAPHGFGTRVYANGNRYTGSWVCGRRCGRGVIVCADGSGYDGEWAEDRRQGYGILTIPGRCVYRGEWKNGMLHGHGTWIGDDGIVHDGEWKESVRRGHGICTGADGSTYDGEWNGDTFNGHAVAVGDDGKRYEGGWLQRGVGPGNSRSYGRGVCTYPDGSVIDGTWDGTECLSCTIIVHPPRDDPGMCASQPCMACRALVRGSTAGASA